MEGKKLTCLSHQNAPEHIFPGKVQEDVELWPEALAHCYESGNVAESPPVGTCRGLTMCKQHQVVRWETDCLYTCYLVLKIVIC